MAQDDQRRTRRLGAAVKAAARGIDSNARLVTAVRLARELLPGDAEYGDPLSTGGREQAHLAGRRLAELTDKRPGLMRETGFTALQLWQAVSESQGRGKGTRELTIAFTDLVEFSDWALDAGDDAALELLRDVARAIEPPVADAGGKVVKRLGDGMMAVFESPQDALDAIRAGCERLAQVDVDGYDPQLRAGIHHGRPRKIGGDYVGVDVNIAARVAEQAGAGELLVSGAALEQLDRDGLETRKRRRFKVKGVPRDLEAYAVSLT